MLARTRADRGHQHGICAVWFGDNRPDLERQLKDDFPAASTDGADKAFDGWVKAVIERIEHPGAETDLPLDMTGTPFQKRVWAALRKIPSGRTASYSQIAARINHPKAQGAVARACATNPVGVIVPCHRVIASDGKISGYAGGVERKRALLKREAENARAPLSLDHRGRSGVATPVFRRVRLGGRVFGNAARCDDASAKADPTGWDFRRIDLV